MMAAAADRSPPVYASRAVRRSTTRRKETVGVAYSLPQWVARLTTRRRAHLHSSHRPRVGEAWCLWLSSSANLEVDEIDGDLLVRVSDDGIGASAPHTGSGLIGLADRVGAHGGRFAVSNSPGRGTVVEATLPCASS